MNQMNGDMEIELCGEAHILTNCHLTCMEIEGRSGKGLVQLGYDFVNQRVSILDIASVIYAGVVGTINPKTVKDMPWDFLEIQKLVAEHGVFRLYPYCMKFVSGLVRGQSQEEIEEKNHQSGDSSESQPATVSRAQRRKNSRGAKSRG